MCCYLTRTTKETHQIVTDNLDETPTYGGWVEAKGPRYCPAIEDKVLYHGHFWSVTLFDKRLCFDLLCVIDLNLKRSWKEKLVSLHRLTFLPSHSLKHNRIFVCCRL